jgi:RNA polymerase sigma-70 factor, ECF subfamily
MMTTVTGGPLPTDKSLLRRFRSGDDGAAADLYRRYAGRLRALASAQCAMDLRVRFDADDIVQSVFRTFFQGLRESAYEVPEGQELWGLLFVIALHKIRNQANFHRAAKRDIGQTVGGEFLTTHFASDEASLNYLLVLIEDEVKEYPPVNRQIVRMRIEGYEVGEIVRATGRSRRTVERVLQNFRQRLSDAH